MEPSSPSPGPSTSPQPKAGEAVKSTKAIINETRANLFFSIIFPPVLNYSIYNSF